MPENDLLAIEGQARGLAEQLVLAAEALVRYRGAAYRQRFRLTDLHYRLLMHVAKRGPISLGDLSNLVNRDCGQISRTVKALIESGFMRSERRRGSPGMGIELSHKGRSTYEAMAKIGEEWEFALSALMPLHEIALASQAAGRLHAAALRIHEGSGEPPLLGVTGL